MENLKKASHNILEQLQVVLAQLDSNAYAMPLEVLHGSSLGQHTRHIIEFFQCLLQTPGSGVLNYDLRKRDHAIENDPDAARRATEDIMEQVKQQEQDYSLWLESDYGLAGSLPTKVPSSFLRELAYNVEHAIHHMAILKIGIFTYFPKVSLPHHFGIASSTVRHRQQTSVKS